MKVISLGAGVQSSTMFLMACRGELPRPDVAIFADTQGEPRGVYNYLEFLKGEGVKAGIPLYVATKGSLKDDTLSYISGESKRAASIPAFVKKEGQQQEGRLWRQCTSEYKIMVVRKKVRELLHENPEYKKPVEMWIGISTDEILRMKESNVKYIKHYWPLIDKGMSRSDCLEWYNGKGYPVPARSACTFCPYRKNEEWVRMKIEDPQSFADAVEFDRKIREQPKLNGKAYLHRSLVPLEDVNFASLKGFDPGWEEECEGMCGV